MGPAHFLIFLKGFALGQVVDLLYACGVQNGEQFAVLVQLCAAQNVDADLLAFGRGTQECVQHLVDGAGAALFLIKAAQTAAVVYADRNTDLLLHLLGQQLVVGGQQGALAAGQQDNAAGAALGGDLSGGFLGLGDVVAGDHIHFVEHQERQTPLSLHLHKINGTMSGTGQSGYINQLYARDTHQLAKHFAFSAGRRKTNGFYFFDELHQAILLLIKLLGA